jgi:hypothetical protein
MKKTTYICITILIVISTVGLSGCFDINTNPPDLDGDNGEEQEGQKEYIVSRLIQMDYEGSPGTRCIFLVFENGQIRTIYYGDTENFSLKYNTLGNFTFTKAGPYKKILDIEYLE